MPETLVITTRQNVLDIVEHLRGVEHFKIDVESDFTKGLKAIFYRLPEVVFIQNEISGISGEKVASQVKTLLEDEPIRLVLLREHTGEWDSGYLGFDAVIDIDLPFDELISRFRQEIEALSLSGAETLTEPVYGETPEGLLQDSQPPKDNLEFDPFSDIFPAQFQHNWVPVSTESEPVAQTETWQQYAPIDLSPVDDEFSFDPPGDIVTSIPHDKPADPDQSIKEQKPDELKSTEKSFGKPSEEEEAKEFRLADRESPHHLFATMSGDEAGDDPLPQAETAPPADSTVNRLRLKGVQAQSDLLKTELNDIQLSPDSSGPSSTPFDATVGTGPKKVSGPPSSVRSYHRSPAASGPRIASEFRGKKSFSGGYAEKKSISRTLTPLLLLAIVGLSTYMLVQHWDDLTAIFSKGKEPVEIPQSPPPRDLTKLPSFIPSVAPDSAYATAHPGWERYATDGIEYLVFRENHKIRAIQVIAGSEGKISESFIRMCIRETTGLPNGENWVREKRDDFIVEKGILRDKGEAVVYRKMPEGEIRGIVLTFN